MSRATAAADKATGKDTETAGAKPGAPDAAQTPAQMTGSREAFDERINYAELAPKLCDEINLVLDKLQSKPAITTDAGLMTVERLAPEGWAEGSVNGATRQQPLTTEYLLAITRQIFGHIQS